jgi:catechol 2,3-dioxygenase-like lactoylglutathione lyase family enzyme
MIDDKRELTGIHHITAIAGDPQANIDFYTKVLGLRMIKLTVNFDDPGAYHLYFGDELGRPGTALTFFSWPGARKGKIGVGQAESLSFSVPERGMGYWAGRLSSHGIHIEKTGQRFDEEFMSFYDPDGLELELVASQQADTRVGWIKGPVPAEHVIRGFHHATLIERSLEPTARMLTALLGFRQVGQSENVTRFEIGPGGPGATVDIIKAADISVGLVAVGSIHHIAWRTPNDAEQVAWHAAIAQKGINVTQIINRLYFQSIYFREPGGVLFEIATDLPGFLVDETPDQLGSKLQLPPWMERNRSIIEQNLPPVEIRRVYQKT